MGRQPKTDLSSKFLKLLQLIGANVSFLREGKKMTQVELAKKSKVSVTTINEIETKRFRDIRLSTLYSIAQILDIPVVQFFIESDLELSPKDKIQLLQASEAIFRITRKLEES